MNQGKIQGVVCQFYLMVSFVHSWIRKSCTYLYMFQSLTNWLIARLSTWDCLRRPSRNGPEFRPSKVLGAFCLAYFIPQFCELHWLPVAFQVQFNILVITFKALHGIGFYLRTISPHHIQSHRVAVVQVPSLKHFICWVLGGSTFLVAIRSFEIISKIWEEWWGYFFQPFRSLGKPHSFSKHETDSVVHSIGGLTHDGKLMIFLILILLVLVSCLRSFCEMGSDVSHYNKII